MSLPNDPNFLWRCELFDNQPSEVLQAVLAQGQSVEYGPGEVVVRQGDTGDRLYVIEEGILEVLALSSDSTEPVPIAYLGTGEVLGELALLTGSPRSATVRCPQGAKLFAVEKAVFLDLLDQLPVLSRHLCVVLARRLEATNLKLPRSPGKQLQGKLEYFDLATVIQTLIGSHQTGSLSVSLDKQKLAELFFFRGNIARAKYRNLVGDDAVYELFLSPVDGEFSFTGREVTESEIQTDVSLPAITLLMESVRLQDELPLLQERLPDPTRTFRPKTENLAWDEAETLELAAAVWSRLKRGARLADLQREIRNCSHSIYRTVVALIDSGQIE